MNPALNAFLFAGAIFLGMYLCLEIGLRLGKRQLALDPDGARQGIGAIEGAVFALLGLLVAFTFSGAASRFDDRRHLIREEANAIGTAWLRLDLLPKKACSDLQELFRQYLDARLATYSKLPDLAAARAEFARSNALQNEIWATAVAACRESGSQAAHMLLLPALNDMIDITTTRSEATKMHPPLVIFGMLGLLALVAALFAGYGMAGAKSRNWIHVLGLIAVITMTIYVIVDMEYPRFGLINVKSSDQVLIDVRASMK
jgi:hypothetical protein